MKRNLIIGDVIFIAVIALFCIAAAFFIYSGGGSGSAENQEVCVRINGDVYKRFSLDEEVEEYIADTGMKLVVSGGKAYISESGCADQICVNTSAITVGSPYGKSIVCIPNKVTVTKESAEADFPDKQEVDAVAG